jgi:hypothetical protein
MQACGHFVFLWELNSPASEFDSVDSTSSLMKLLTLRLSSDEIQGEDLSE